MKSKSLLSTVAIVSFFFLSSCSQSNEKSNTSAFSISEIDGKGCLLNSESGELYFFSNNSKMVRKVDIINGTYTIIELSEEGSTTEEEAKKQMILPVEQTTDTVATE